MFFLNRIWPRVTAINWISIIASLNNKNEIIEKKQLPKQLHYTNFEMSYSWN